MIQILIRKQKQKQKMIWFELLKIILFKDFLNNIIHNDQNMVNSCIEYVWLDGHKNLRSKTKVMNLDIFLTNNLNDQLQMLPDWNYDGSSTYQASGSDSEVLIKPQYCIRDPFRKSPDRNNLIVLCDTYKSDGITPHESNSRVYAERVLSNESVVQNEPWFGIEQEYFLFDNNSDKNYIPSGSSKKLDQMSHQGPYYCSIGAGNNIARHVVEEHLEACLYADLDITGINAEVAPSQYEFQIKATGLDAPDQLWLARYMLIRIAEKYNMIVCFDPKPLGPYWNGSGCHVNYSTKFMREGDPYTNKTGLEFIKDALLKLIKNHSKHIQSYGANNHLRLTGKHETSSIDKCTFGQADRGASIRLPNSTVLEEKGYFEDRRPAANMDPYLVCGLLYETTQLN